MLINTTMVISGKQITRTDSSLSLGFFSEWYVKYNQSEFCNDFCKTDTVCVCIKYNSVIREEGHMEVTVLVQNV